MMRLASLVGAEEDIAIYQQARENIYEAFNKKFYCPEDGSFETGFEDDRAVAVGMTKYRQASSIISVMTGLVPEENLDHVMERLVKDIHEKDDHLDTGVVGTKYILPLLADYGLEDLAWKILMQDTYPSWGFWLANGADTTWEGYEISTRSLDHYFLGTYDQFFYTHLSGIREIKDGCKNIIIKPMFYPQLDHAGTRMQTVRGELVSSWKREADGRVCLNVKVPYGANAQIYLPAGEIEITKGQEGIMALKTEEPEYEKLRMNIKDEKKAQMNILDVVSGEYVICF